MNGNTANTGNEPGAAPCRALPRAWRSGLALMLRDVVDGLLDGGDLLRILVRNLRLELLLERHHELDGIERIGPQIVHERGIAGDFLFLDPQLLGDDLFYPFFNAAHRSLVLCDAKACRVHWEAGVARPGVTWTAHFMGNDRPPPRNRSCGNSMAWLARAVRGCSSRR